ncbi:MAG: hypothetical protein QOG85_1190 [Gaiellaceae bacterium]|jgi:uncharacterized protein YvpB|nr:hypothetical protein [Gaiellaceae bacterium]
MRAGLVATFALVVVLVASACGGTKHTTYPISVYIAGQHIGAVGPGEAESFFKHTKLRVTLGYAHSIVTAPDAVERVNHALSLRHGRINLPFKPVVSTVSVAGQHQLFPHASEVTALSELLSVVSIDAPAVHLVKQVATSGPLVPQPVPGSDLVRWGDPELGFVGNYKRAGRAGFGVYEAPIKHLAAKRGIHLMDLEGKTVADVRSAVLYGHPVMAWVGGSAPDPASWLTPSGKKITVDLGEHAVVLTGARPGSFIVNDPVTGKTLKWSIAEFTKRWALIGHRALALK